MRIISLLPSATETICALGFESELVGISHECDYPISVTDLPRVTRSRIDVSASSADIDEQVRAASNVSQSLFELDADLIESLHPDLILTQSLCSVCAVSHDDLSRVIDRIQPRPRVVDLNPVVLRDLWDNLRKVADACGDGHRGNELSDRINERIRAVEDMAGKSSVRPTVVLLEWLDPLFSAGHWNPELIELAGGKSMLGTAGDRSRQVDWDEVRDLDPDLLVIACCGYSIDRTLEDLPKLVGLRGFKDLKCITTGQVWIADGSQYFNRPGPRIVDSLELLAHVIHQDRIALPSYITPPVRMKKEPRPASGQW